MAHTKTPWRVRRNLGRKSEIGITGGSAPFIIAIMGNQKRWPLEAAANAHHIVRCVNSNDALVSALVSALEMVMKANDWRLDPPEDSYGKKAYAAARAALALALANGESNE